MAEFVDNFDQDRPTKRVIRSRKNTPEERRRQRQEWRKKQQVEKLANSENFSANSTAQQEANDLMPGIQHEAKEKEPSPKQCFAPEKIKKPRLASLRADCGETKMTNLASSREAVMVQMALGADAEDVHKQPQIKRQDFMTTKKTTVNRASRFKPRELCPEHIEYSSANPVGSGSFGKCFHGRYRSIDVIVKQMTHDNTAEDQERARKNLLHEAMVISALGDQPSLPMIFGVITKDLPFCLVMQFHGVNEESLTLHQAANTNKLITASCISIFIKICFALSYVHLKGYLHNDLKANNVVLERTSVSEEFNPVVIDFGKSTKAPSLPMYRELNGQKCIGKSYLAPEVRSERLYSVASDIYSLGLMLKSISCMVGFYQKVRTLVKHSTRESPSGRPSLKIFSHKIAEVKFKDCLECQ